jgi:hypothetical protein
MAREAPDTPQMAPLHRAAERFWRGRGVSVISSSAAGGLCPKSQVAQRDKRLIFTLAAGIILWTLQLSGKRPSYPELVESNQIYRHKAAKWQNEAHPLCGLILTHGDTQKFWGNVLAQLPS